MIRIKGYILNENNIKVIENDEDLLTIIFKDGSYRETQGTFDDIEWNYDTDMYCKVMTKIQNRNKELEEENKKLKEEYKELVETNYDLADKLKSQKEENKKLKEELKALKGE